MLSFSHLTKRKQVKMLTFKEFLVESKIPSNLQKFLNKFSPDETSWAKATGEIVTIANLIDELLGIDTAPKTRSRTPAEHNKVHVDRIVKNFPKLSAQEKKIVFDQYGEWFK